MSFILLRTRRKNVVKIFDVLLSLSSKLLHSYSGTVNSTVMLNLNNLQRLDSSCIANVLSSINLTRLDRSLFLSLLTVDGKLGLAFSFSYDSSSRGNLTTTSLLSYRSLDSISSRANTNSRLDLNALEKDIYRALGLVLDVSITLNNKVTQREFALVTSTPTISFTTVYLLVHTGLANTISAVTQQIKQNTEFTGGLNLQARLSLNQKLSLTSDLRILIQATLALSYSSRLVSSSKLNSIGTLILSLIESDGYDSSAVIQALVDLGLTKKISSSIERIIYNTINLGSKITVTTDSLRTVNQTVKISSIASASILGQALVNAGIDLTDIKSITVTETAIVIVTPEGRTLEVKFAEAGRVLIQGAEDRILN